MLELFILGCIVGCMCFSFTKLYKKVQELKDTYYFAQEDFKELDTRKRKFYKSYTKDFKFFTERVSFYKTLIKPQYKGKK